MSLTQGLNYKYVFIILFLSLTRSDVPRDEFGFYGWTEDFTPDSIVNLALRLYLILIIESIIIQSFKDPVSILADSFRLSLFVQVNKF